MSKRKSPRADIPVSFRLPVDLQKALVEKARTEDINFSQLARRALRREAGIPIKKAPEFKLVPL